MLERELREGTSQRTIEAWVKEQAWEQMVHKAEGRLARTAISFVNFKDELPYFIAAVLPLLREAGLREA